MLDRDKDKIIADMTQTAKDALNPEAEKVIEGIAKLWQIHPTSAKELEESFLMFLEGQAAP